MAAQHRRQPPPHHPAPAPASTKAMPPKHPLTLQPRSSADVLALQRTVGNRATMRILRQHAASAAPQAAPVQRQVTIKHEEGPITDPITILKWLGPEGEPLDLRLIREYTSASSAVYLPDAQKQFLENLQIFAALHGLSLTPGEEKKEKKEKGTIWKTKTLEKEFQKNKEILGRHYDTGHHKLPKSDVGKLYGWMTADQAARAKAQLDVAQTGEASSFKSLGSNLAVGPNSGVRDKDPGNKAVDSNKGKSGKSTPRSEIYETLFLFVRSRNTDGPLSESDFTMVLDLLVTAEKIHYAKTGGELVDTDVSMWVWDEAKKKYDRNPVADYVPDVPKNTSVRELKKEQFKADLHARKGVSFYDLTDPDYYSDPYAEVAEPLDYSGAFIYKDHLDEIKDLKKKRRENSQTSKPSKSSASKAEIEMPRAEHSPTTTGGLLKKEDEKTDS